MTVFGNYARYYDLLYRDKDYKGEAQYLSGLITRHAPEAASILELGCGTGAHARLLAEAGYAVHGVDLSEEMLAVAQQRKSACPAAVADRLAFSRGDVRSVRVDGAFDVVVSLFHVISYLPTNADLSAALATVKEHLKPGGIFIFDCWYGPAVLTDRPAVRVKQLEDEHIAVTRLAEPVMHPRENLVDVNYRVFIRDKGTDAVQEVRETHRMRYLFHTELELLAQQHGLAIVESAEWMTGREPGYDTWGVCLVLKG